MTLKRYNKATAAVLAGALVSVLGAFVEIEPTVLDSLQVLLVGVLVYFVPNGE